MIDFYYNLRQHMLDTMQISLKQIRQAVGFGVQELSEILGITRQSLNNLETNKNKMSVVQYLAICGFLDNLMKDKPELMAVIYVILTTNENQNNNGVFKITGNTSLLRKWFMSFPDNSKVVNLITDGNLIAEESDFNNIAENYKIFLDKSVLLYSQAEDLFEKLSFKMSAFQSKYVVPLVVIEQIQKALLLSDSSTSDTQNAISRIMSFQNKNLLEIRGEKDDIDEINTFISVFAKFKHLYRLAIITQDFKMAKQISKLNEKEISGFDILILKISSENTLEKWLLEDSVNEMPKVADCSSEVLSDEYETLGLTGWDTI